MKVEEIEGIIEQGTDAMSVKRVFGEPIRQDGITLIPVAKVRGMGGGGSGEGPEAQGRGWGSGFGITARGLGTYVIKGDDVRFVPAIDVNRIVLIAGFVAVAAMLLIGRPVVKARTAR